MTLPHATSVTYLFVAAFLAIAVAVERASVAPATAMRAPVEAMAAAMAPAVANPRGSLAIPVRGVSVDALADNWGEARSENRAHQGIDILAPLGTPVLAVADGRIVRFFDSERGGVTIYQFDSSERWVYYYAHLQARAVSLAEGDVVRQGDVIGYVGQTGNAPVPHLHFEIQRLGPEKRWWEAEAVNPYPYLLSGRAPYAP